jgi:hypothetical protein
MCADTSPFLEKQETAEQIRLHAEPIEAAHVARAFQMAEVAISRHLFADILRLIAELRPPPDPAPA